MIVSRACFLLIFICSWPVVFPFGSYRSVQELAGFRFNTSSIRDEQCRNHTELWMRSLTKFVSSVGTNCKDNDKQCEQNKQHAIEENLFAAKQVDSFGRLPSGILEYDTLWQGSWEECMAVKTSKAPSYSTHYCWVSLALDSSSQSNSSACSSPLKVMWSVCMPENCGNQDIQEILETMNSDERVPVSFCSVTCKPPTGPPKDAIFWIVTAYCVLIMAIMLVSSTVDYATSDDDVFGRLRSNFGIRMLLTFSMYTNGAEILSHQKRAGQIDCLHCIRTISMTWVIAGHLMTTFALGNNVLSVVDATHYILNDVFFNAFLAVDSFLFIGGLLLAFLFFKQMDKSPRTMRNPIYWMLFYIHRILRVIPAYALFIGFDVAMYNHFMLGPLLSGPVSEVETCKKYWWRNLLFINNFFDFDQLCMGHSWYLATDMQIHIFSPLLLVPLFYSKIAGGISAAVLLTISIACCYAAHFIYDFPATLASFFTAGNPAGSPDAFNKYMILVYTAPWVRCTPYVIGVLTGYFLHKTKQKQIKIHPAVAIALWCVSVSIGCACVYGLFNNLKGVPIPTVSSASYDNFSRLGWALALSWVVIACQNNAAGPIKNLMELELWAPLSRLTFCSYLCHFFLLGAFLSQLRQPIHFVNTFTMYVHEAVPVIAITFFFAFFWSCGCEMSFGKLEKMLTTALAGGSKPRSRRDVVKETQPPIDHPQQVQCTQVDWNSRLQARNWFINGQSLPNGTQLANSYPSNDENRNRSNSVFDYRQSGDKERMHNSKRESDYYRHNDKDAATDYASNHIDDPHRNDSAVMYRRRNDADNWTLSKQRSDETERF